MTAMPQVTNFVTLDEPNAGASGGTTPLAINDLGEIVGGYLDASGHDEGFTYVGGTFGTLDDPASADDTTLTGINDAGAIIGNAVHPFTYNNGQFSTLQESDDTFNDGLSALAINNSGEIVGSYVAIATTPGGPELGAFIDDQGAFTNPTGLGGSVKFTGINNNGEIVGEILSRGAPLDDFLYVDGQATILDLPRNSSDGGAPDITGINDAGLIVGSYVTASGEVGFLDDQGSIATISDPLAGPLGTYVTGINNSGQIVGFYYDSSDIAHGFVADYTAAEGGQDYTLSAANDYSVSLYNTDDDWDFVTGSNGAVSLTSAQTSVAGLDDTITFAGESGNDVSLYESTNRAGWDVVIGDDGIVNLGGAQASVFGGGDLIYVLGDGAGDSVSLYDTAGNWDAVSGGNAFVYVTNAQVSVSGDNFQLYLLGTSGNAVSLYDTGETWDYVTGSDSTIYLTNANASIYGFDDGVVLTAGSKDEIGLYSSSPSNPDAATGWDVVIGDDEILYVNGASASVFGGGDRLIFPNFDLYGTSADRAAGSLYDTNGNWDAVSGSGVTLYFTDAQASVSGGGYYLNLLGPSGNQVSLYQTDDAWDYVSGANGRIYLTSSQTSVNGGDDTIIFNAGTGNAVSLYGTNGDRDFVQSSVSGAVTLNNAQAQLTGDDYYVYFSGANSLDLAGGANSLTFGAAIGVNEVSGFAPTDTIQFSASDFANFAALSAHLTQSGANAVIALDASDSVTLVGVTASSLTASEFKFD